MIGQSYYQGEFKEQTADEKAASSKIFWCVAGLLLFSFFVFFFGQFFKTWVSKGNMAVKDMQIKRQYVAAAGNISAVRTAEDAVYFTADGAQYRMKRALDSWKNVQPERMTVEGETLLAVTDDGTTGFLQKGTEWYTKELLTGEVVSLPRPETVSLSAQAVGADFVKNRNLLAVEVLDENGESALWQWDFSEGGWTYLTQGSHGSYNYNGEKFYFERDGQIFSLNGKTKEEQTVTSGRLPVLSAFGGYLAYTAHSEMTGQEEVFVCSQDDPETVFQVTNSAGLVERMECLELEWERDAVGLYVVQRTEDGIRTKYYEMASIGADTALAASAFYEACLLNDAETAELIWPGEAQSEDMRHFRENGLGFYAEEKNSGLSGHGMYQNADRQFFTAESAMPYALWDGKLYFKPAKESYAPEHYLENEKMMFGMKDDRVWQQDANGVMTLLSEQVFPNAVCCAYNLGHDDITVLQQKDGFYQCSIFNQNGSYWEIPLSLPEGAAPYALSFSRTGHVGAVHYTCGEQEGVAILSLKKKKQIDSVFLSDVEKTFWSSNRLIVYSGDDTLKVRWVYEPSEGTLTLQEVF